MNIALYGMETALLQAYKVKERPQVVRYADDFAIFHPTKEGVKEAQTVVESWLREIGLELKPSKTRISHTLTPYQGNIGMDFLGFTIRQKPVGKTEQEQMDEDNHLVSKCSSLQVKKPSRDRSEN